MMKIGELVKDNIGKMFQHCESDPAELLRLMSAQGIVAVHLGWLGQIGEDSFDERDWQETKAYFGNGCGYCGDSMADQMDHAPAWEHHTRVQEVQYRQAS